LTPRLGAANPEAMSTSDSAPYELFYWPSIPGRGEFVRLALEDAGATYLDVARLPASQGGGVPAMLALLKGGGTGLVPFAPPFLRVGPLVLAQSTNILHYLGPRLGLAPSDEGARAELNQLALTLADLVAEVHDTHHPVATGLYYADQKPEALRRTTSFVKERLPKFLGYFERMLERAGASAEGLLGSHSYVDLGIFHVLAGLDYAFPRAMVAQSPKIPGLRALAARVAARPNVAAYLASPRRLAFNENGIFRRYPELDLE
jgi:glutathione S-transferase